MNRRKCRSAPTPIRATTPREITIEILDIAGVLLDRLGPVSIEPDIRFQAFHLVDIEADAAWCRVKVRGTRRAIRGSFYITKASGDTIAALEVR